MTSADTDASYLVSSVVAAFNGSASILRTIYTSGLRNSDTIGKLKPQKELLDGLQGAAQQIARAFAIGKQSLGDSYGEGHDDTKHELARLCDAVRIQIQGPLKLIKESDDVELDAEQMLDSVLCKKKVAMDICEQLRRMPDAQVPSIFDSDRSHFAELPESSSFRARSQSSLHAQNGSSEISDNRADSPVPSEDYSDKILVRSTSQALSTSSSNTVASSDHRQSAISRTSQYSHPSPPHPSPATIESLSHRLSIATHRDSRPSQSNSRQTSNPGTPIERTTSMTSIQTTIGSPIQPSISRQSTASMASMSRRPTIYTQPPSAVIPSTSDNTAPISPTTSQRSTITDDPHKANNYHGFCKGAWTIRDDPKKGLVAQVVPVGMYGRKELFRCKHCAFYGEVTLVNKTKTFDNRVRIDSATGIQYKWIFLAKSHAKVKDKAVGGSPPAYGCTECVDSGRRTSIYANAAALLDHISRNHRDGVRAAERPADPFWQGGTISPEGSWDLYTPVWQPNEVQSPVVWTMD